MKRWLANLICATTLLGAQAATLAQPAARDARSMPGFAAVWKQAIGVSVGVFGLDDPLTRAARTNGDEPSPRVGAGFFVDAGGRIATSAHLVAGADKILVRLPDGRYVQASLLGADATTDVAVLDIEAAHATPLIGRSESLQPGDWVLAVGEPYGLPRSLSAGIVGGLDRHFREDGEVLFIQSDVPLNPGNSGGPLLDVDGAIVGMNSRTIAGVFGTTGLSLSVPIEIVLQIVREVGAHGASPRPHLGAAFDDLSPEDAWEIGRGAASSGVEITDVTHASVAQRIGLQAGDVVLQFGDRAVHDSADFAHMLLAWRGDAPARLVVRRANALHYLTYDTKMAKDAVAWHGQPKF